MLVAASNLINILRHKKSKDHLQELLGFLPENEVQFLTPPESPGGRYSLSHQIPTHQLTEKTSIKGSAPELQLQHCQMIMNPCPYEERSSVCLYTGYEDRDYDQTSPI